VNPGSAAKGRALETSLPPPRKIVAYDDAPDTAGANNEKVRKTFANLQKRNV
jgi:hypothetical protein